MPIVSNQLYFMTVMNEIEAFCVSQLLLISYETNTHNL